MTRWCRAGRTAAAVLAVLSLSVCASAGPEEGQPARWGAILVAGDNAQPVFDNAVTAMAARLRRSGAAGDIVILSAAEPGSERAATFDNLRRAAADLRLGPSDGCLFFMTSHGVPGQGLAFALGNRALSPGQLDRLLDGACGPRPTVVIASGCFSGIYVDEALAQPNRIVLTASRTDRPSFGCAVDRTYTFYDDCLLASLRPGASWRAIFQEIHTCVAAKETALNADPSEPQAVFGRQVEALAAF